MLRFDKVKEWLRLLRPSYSHNLNIPLAHAAKRVKAAPGYIRAGASWKAASWIEAQT